MQPNVEPGSTTSPTSTPALTIRRNYMAVCDTTACATDALGMWRWLVAVGSVDWPRTPLPLLCVMTWYSGLQCIALFLVAQTKHGEVRYAGKHCAGQAGAALCELVSSFGDGEVAGPQSSKSGRFRRHDDGLGSVRGFGRVACHFWRLPLRTPISQNMCSMRSTTSARRS